MRQRERGRERRGGSESTQALGTRKKQRKKRKEESSSTFPPSKLVELKKREAHSPISPATS